MSEGWSPVSWGVAGRALPGETASGDLDVVEEFPDGVLVGVVDGLGHGEEACRVARRAVEVLRAAPGEPVASLVSRCHEALKGTRGVVMSVASFLPSRGTMTWLGVGNVEAVMFRAGNHGTGTHEWMVPAGGVVGYQLPALRPAVVGLAPGDTLVLATDGIRRTFAEALRPQGDPQAVAGEILRRFGSDRDDALVLVARYRGEAP